MKDTEIHIVPMAPSLSMLIELGDVDIGSDKLPNPHLVRFIENIFETIPRMINSCQEEDMDVMFVRDFIESGCLEGTHLPIEKIVRYSYDAVMYYMELFVDIGIVHKHMYLQSIFINKLNICCYTFSMSKKERPKNLLEI